MLSTPNRKLPFLKVDQIAQVEMLHQVRPTLKGCSNLFKVGQMQCLENVNRHGPSKGASGHFSEDFQIPCRNGSTGIRTLDLRRVRATS